MLTLINETIYKRCDEILLNDETYRRSNLRIVEIESALKKSFTPQQLSEYKELEQEIMRASAYREELLYRQGFIDGGTVLTSSRF